MKNIKLGNSVINENSRPYIIAEIGVNHEGSLEKAKKLIELSAEGGASAAKFQTYKADKLASKNSPAYWDINKEPTESQHKLFKKYDAFNENDYVKLYDHCNKHKIDFLSTPFDDDSLDFLDPILPFFKIASADLTNLPFLRKVASKSKPVLLSTGASNLSEINTAVNELEKFGCNEVVLLHCILNYPTEYKNANLRMIKSLSSAFPDKMIGYSDHTLPDKNMSSLITSYLLGAMIIEKHFTDDKSLPGNDHYHAMDINDLVNLNKLIDSLNISLGSHNIKKPIKSEHISRKNARRSVVVRKKILEGAIILENDITYKRPGTGISPLFWDEIIGLKVNKDLDEDHILQWSDIDHQN